MSNLNMPTVAQLQAELDRLKKKENGGGGFIALILVIIAVIALIFVSIWKWTPFYTINGSTMSPTLQEGTVVIALNTDKLERGDIAVIRFGSRVLIKRIIAVGGDELSIDTDGNVYINGSLLEEPYVSEKSLGGCDYTFPITIPEGYYFVMGDKRDVSLDSRSNDLGCVDGSSISGKVIFKVLPLGSFGTVK